MASFHHATKWELETAQLKAIRCYQKVGNGYRSPLLFIHLQLCTDYLFCKLGFHWKALTGNYMRHWVWEPCLRRSSPAWVAQLFFFSSVCNPELIEVNGNFPCNLNENRLHHSVMCPILFSTRILVRCCLGFSWFNFYWIHTSPIEWKLEGSQWNGSSSPCP